MNKRIKKGHGRRDYIAIKDKVEELISKGHCYKDIYEILNVKMSYMQFWKYATGKTPLYPVRNIIKQNTIKEQKTIQTNMQQNEQQQKVNIQPKVEVQHEQTVQSAPKRKIIGQEEKQEVKITRPEDMF